jgi:pSer/pThr/pTyr-binding forkhead associated (FHA) protein
MVPDPAGVVAAVAAPPAGVVAAVAAPPAGVVAAVAAPPAAAVRVPQPSASRPPTTPAVSAIGAHEAVDAEWGDASEGIAPSRRGAVLAKLGARSATPGSIPSSVADKNSSVAPSRDAAGGRGKPSQEELMEQARHYVCRSCSSGVPSGHKFCGRCGEAVPPEIVQLQTTFFGDMQNPAKAKLILIRGEGMDGLSFHLKAEQHIVGREGQLPFPDDVFVSRRHANFFYRDGKLVVRDEGSLNGVFVRIRGTVRLEFGDTFLVGEQVFRVDGNPRDDDGNAPDGTQFYSSPKHASAFRVSQLLQGGAVGMSVAARGTSLAIGREGGDLNFPSDLYMSGTHCRIDASADQLTLTDVGSRNGTYLRMKSERELGHGDYLFLGRKLLRVELNSN